MSIIRVPCPRLCVGMLLPMGCMPTRWVGMAPKSFVVFGALSHCALSLLVCVGCEDARVTKYTAPREKNAPDFTRMESYKTPDGWKRLAKPAEFSLATFQIGEGNKPVIVTLSRSAGSFGGLTANVERWRGKVGLPEADEKKMLEDVKWLTVNGEKTPYVDLSNPEKKDADRILGVYALRGPVTWVFKMQGPPELVGVHKSEFEAFVQSVKFGGTGASDG